ncbi:hypothetical protein L208DRAFT_1377382 [Tricholoma matsutake]|nr:hypothetical protein L208DRAFT_1377382 [Tricholoma matsutake 945]
MAIETLDDEVGEEAVKIYLEEEDSLTDHIDALLTESLEDFPEDDTSDSAARHAAEITCANITDEMWLEREGFEGRKVSKFMMGLEKTKGIVQYTAYLFAWLLLLCIEEVICVDFESINIIPVECFDVHLKTQKSAQTGITHAWTLHANDNNPKIRPMWALIWLAVLYGENITLSGPLFLKVNKNGAIMQDTPVTSSMLS